MALPFPLPNVLVPSPARGRRFAQMLVGTATVLVAGTGYAYLQGDAAPGGLLDAAPPAAAVVLPAENPPAGQDVSGHPAGTAVADAGTQYVTVPSGDASPDKIASQAGVYPLQLLALNPGVNFFKLTPGQQIRVR